MRIGILTFHRAHNCGAMLQNYALQVVLSRMGMSPTTIDFNNIGEDRRFRVIPGLTFRQRVRQIIEFVLSIGVYDLRLMRFHRFRKRNLRTTSWIADGKIPLDLDFYIVGSDQVFQPNLTGKYRNTFLLGEIPPTKRMSYAASFGYESLPEEFRSEFRESLARFHAISVREESGARIIKEELGLDLPVEVVLDPTLLLDSADYEEIETKCRIPKKFVLVYSIGGAREKLREVATNIASKLRADVVFVNACRRSWFKTPLSDWLSVSPDRLIYLIRHAEYVITTSFHGVAFSLIYRRQFTAIIPRTSKVAGRVPALLSRLGISNRAISEDAPLNAYIGQSDSYIDYNAIKLRLGELRKASIAFLEKALAQATVRY